jgi:hypothetical protein
MTCASHASAMLLYPEDLQPVTHAFFALRAISRTSSQV